MARKSTTQHYLIQEPSTGLYAAFGPKGARLTYAAHATRFSTARDATIAASTNINDQPHELVRIDRA